MLVALLSVAAVVHPLRPILALGLLAWLLRVRLGQGSVPAVLGAVLPVALILAWGALPQPLEPSSVDWCEAPLSPPSLWRLAEAGIGLAGIVALVMAGMGSFGDLGLSPAGLSGRAKEGWLTNWD